MNTIKYSVIVATYNRAELLKQCLEAIASQNIPKSEYELLLINDGAKDSTDEVVKRFSQSHPDLNFTYFKQKNSGPAKARNVGINNAKGEIIFFTDDDCVVPPDWINILSEAYVRHPDIVGAGGWYEYPQTWKNSWLKKIYADYTATTLRISYGKRIDTAEIKNNIFLRNPSGNTSNMSYKKELLIKVGGFDESIDFVGLIDWELKKRIMDLGHYLLYMPYNVFHLKPLGLSDIMDKFINRGRGHCHLVNKNPELFATYYPGLNKASKLIDRLPSRQLALIFCIHIDLLLRRIGWEYQKFIERREKFSENKITILFKKWGIRSGALGINNLEIIENNGNKIKKILRVYYPKGSASPRFARENHAFIGGAHFYANLGINQIEKAVLKYKIMFPMDFNFVKGGKLPGLFGGKSQYNWSRSTPNGFDGFSIRLMWRENGNGEVYAYLPDSKNYGTSIGQGNWRFKKGVWQCIEQEIVLNSPNAYDGKMLIKIDSTIVVNANNILFRNTPNLKIDGLLFSTFFGGHDASWVTPKSTYIDFSGFNINNLYLEI